MITSNIILVSGWIVSGFLSSVIYLWLNEKATVRDIFLIPVATAFGFITLLVVSFNAITKYKNVVVWDGKKERRQGVPYDELRAYREDCIALKGKLRESQKTEERALNKKSDAEARYYTLEQQQKALFKDLDKLADKNPAVRKILKKFFKTV